MAVRVACSWDLLLGHAPGVCMCWVTAGTASSLQARMLLAEGLLFLLFVVVVVVKHT